VINSIWHGFRDNL